MEEITPPEGDTAVGVPLVLHVSRCRRRGGMGVRGSTFSDLRKSFVSESSISLTPGLRTMEEMGRLCRESVHLQHPCESAK